jgi:hypothetical protein
MLTKTRATIIALIPSAGLTGAAIGPAVSAAQDFFALAVLEDQWPVNTSLTTSSPFSAGL